MSRETINLTDELRDYLISVSVREPEILKELRDETAKLENAQMQISPRLLCQMMAKLSPMT